MFQERKMFSFDGKREPENHQPFQIINTPPAGPKERGQMDKSFKLRLFGEKQAGRFDFLCVFM
ncbi:MAG: hypothetical protein V8R95_00045 [Faecalibacterium sp.]